MKVSAINLSNILYSFKSQSNIGNEKKTDGKNKISTSNVILVLAAIAATTAAVIFGIKYGRLNQKTKELIESTKEKLQKDFNVIKEGSETILKLANDNETQKFAKLSENEINALLSDVTKIDGNLVVNYKNKLDAPNLKNINGYFNAKAIKSLNLPKLETVWDNFMLEALNDLNVGNLKKVDGCFQISNIRNAEFNNLESTSICNILSCENIKLNNLNKFTQLNEKNCVYENYKDKNYICLKSSKNIEINKINKIDCVYLLDSSNISMSNLENGELYLNYVENSKFPKFNKDKAEEKGCKDIMLKVN